MSWAFERIQRIMREKQTNLTKRDIFEIEILSGGLDIDEFEAYGDLREAIWLIENDTSNSEFFPDT